MRLLQRVAISREGWCYLVVMVFILAGALLRQINLLVILFGMLAGPMLASWRLVKATLRRLDVKRNLPDSISAGDLLIVEIVAANRRRRLPSWVVVVQDFIRPQASAGSSQLIQPRVLFTFLPAGRTTSMTYRGRLTQRGLYQFGPLRMSTRFPLGLLWHSVNLGQKDELIVFPRLGRLTPLFNRLQNSAEPGVGQATRQQGFLEGEFYALRDWRSGDSRRWVHWRTTARRQTAVVRQFEQQRNQDVAVVLDAWQPDKPREEHADAVELAVSFAASIVADLCRRGGRWLCLAIAGREHWLENGPTSTALLHESMRGLALAQATSADRVGDVLAATIDRIRPGTRVLLVSSRGVDLSDSGRFETVWADERRRPWLSRIRVFDASQDDLAEFFVPA
jgi:uncharacterized protein (DUF58 family)